MKKIVLFIFFAANLFFTNAFAAVISQDEADTSQFFARIKNDPLKLNIFLNEMPKGGDLHNHLSGASYAENLIQYAKNDNYCINLTDYSLVINPYCPQAQQLASASSNPALFLNTVEHWSMLNFKPGMENQNSNEEHFFSIFPKVAPIVTKHLGQILSEVVSRAGAQHEEYLELMFSSLNEPIIKLGQSVGWNDDFDKLKQAMLKKGLLDLVKKIPPQITSAETEMKKNLHCGTAKADSGCHVTVRYQYEVLRNMPPVQVFAQLLAGFELAKMDPRVVSVNLVQPEDAPTVLQDYDLQMKMVRYFHQQFPTVPITLHAGELAVDGVPPEALRSHIRDAIEIGNAKRIGHGTDIAYEENPMQLLQEMARKHILVETNLTSNAVLLGLQGKDHPILLYLENQVPIALSTDNDGILRTNLTREFARAESTYHFDYETLKRFARNSITYSFLPGKSLWENPDKFIPVDVCSEQKLGIIDPLHSCKEFLNKNEKAKLQWHLEKQFSDFEKKVAEGRF